MRIIPFILYLFLIALHEVIFGNATMILTAAINLSILMILIVALHKSEITSTWFGFIVGLVTVAGSPDLFGWNAFIMAIMGLVAFHIRERLNLESLYARLLLVFGGVLFYNIFSLFITRSEDFLYLLWSGALTGAVYTSIIAWLFFLIKDGRITYTKIKSLF